MEKKVVFLGLARPCHRRYGCSGNLNRRRETKNPARWPGLFRVQLGNAIVASPKCLTQRCEFILFKIGEADRIATNLTLERRTLAMSI
jgi:hypothetical protein